MATNIRGNVVIRILNRQVLADYKSKSAGKTLIRGLLLGLLILFSISCAVNAQEDNIVGNWIVEGEDGYSEEFSVLPSGEFSWSQTQQQVIIFSIKGTYEIKSTYEINRLSGKTRYELTPVIRLKTTDEAGKETKHAIKFFITGKSLYLMENQNTVYIRKGEEDET